MKIILAILIIVTVNLYGQIKNDSVFHYLYNANFETLHSNIKPSDSDFSRFIFAYSFFWQGLVESDFDTYFPMAEKNLCVETKNEDQHINALLNLLQLRIEFSQNNYLSAYSYSTKLKHYFKENTYITNHEINSLLWSIYHYFIASARESFFYRTMLASWPDADKTKGKKMLSDLSDNENVFINTEATYLLGKINLELEQKPELALSDFKKLVGQYPNNKVFKELHRQAIKQCNSVAVMQ